MAARVTVQAEARHAAPRRREARGRLHKELMIGDRASDVEPGHAAGCTTIFIDLGYVDEHPERPDFTVASFGGAAKVVLRTT
jgi:phosphoglycolate phosphatase-like HAD superfamily hydrolase